MEKICQKCNQLNPGEAAFCLNCAAPLNRGQAGGQPENQPWNQPVFGNQPAEQNVVQPLNNSGKASQRATAALGLAIGGLLCCGPFTSIPAAIVGWMEIDAIKKGQSPPSGMTFAQIGLWGGIAAAGIHVIAYLLFVIISMMNASNPNY